MSDINGSKDQPTVIQQNVYVNKSNGVGTAGFVLALIGLVFSWAPVANWILWFLGLLLSFIGLFKSPRGLAIAGFIISIIDLIVILVIVAAIVSIFA